MPTAYRTCPFCEATCGLEIKHSDGVVESVRGDDEDVFSHGFLCPKGVALQALHEDPDRAAGPLGASSADGSFAEATWDEAFAVIAERLPAVIADGGKDAVGAYLGNPSAHNMAAVLYGRVLLKALGTKNIYTASTVDQYPKQMASALMFGTASSVAIPDIDRTDYMLMLGANPLASNGSLMTAPDVRGRLKAIQDRGGKVVVVDPRRTRTAKLADDHLFIRPGTDALALFAILHVLFDEDLAAPGELSELCEGLDEVRDLAAGFSPEEVAGPTGIPADEAARGRARPRRRRERRRLRAHRHDDAGLRHDRLVARRPHQRRQRQPRPPGRRDVHHARRRQLDDARRAGPRQGLDVRPLDLARARARRDLRRAARRLPGARRSRRRARARSAR